MSWDYKATRRVWHIEEEIDDWHHAQQRGQSLLVKRSKRQLHDWVCKAEELLRTSGGSEKARSTLALYALIGRRLLNGKLRLNTAWDLFQHKKSKLVRFAEAQQALYVRQQERQSDEYRAFLQNLEQLLAVPVAWKEATDRFAVGRRIAVVLGSDLYRFLANSSAPPAGVTDTQWRRWRQAASAATAVMAQVRALPGWTRFELAQKARSTPGAEVRDVAGELRDALLWARERPGPETFDALELALVRARGDASLAGECAEADDLLNAALAPSLVQTEIIISEEATAPWYSRHRVALLGLGAAAVTGVLALWLVRRREEP